MSQRKETDSQKKKKKETDSQIEQTSGYQWGQEI